MGNEIEVRNEQVEAIVGTSHQVAEADSKLKQAFDVGHLITPATRVGSLPPGCGVAFSVVRVDPRVNEKGLGTDVFLIEGKLMLQKHVMDRIGSALGVTWLPEHSRRLDDRSDPHYCEYQAVGRLRLFDGQQQVVMGTYELDLRDGSSRAKGMKSRQLDVARQFIVQRAETGARCRAISASGVRRNYSREELQRPFIVAKLHFDGQTDDPVLKKEFARATAAAMIGVESLLYGPQQGVEPEQAAPLIGPSEPRTPPPLPAGEPSEDERAIEAPVGEDEPPEPPEPPAPPAQEAQPQQQELVPGEQVIAYGEEKGTPLSKASKQALADNFSKLEADMKLGMEAEGDRRLLAALVTEIANRERSRA